MNVNAILGKPVLDLSNATTVGRVDDVVIDAESRRVLGFRVGKSASSADWLEWQQLSAVGADAVTIETAERITESPDDQAPGLRGGKALGGRVLTDEGRELGVLDDVDVDVDTGAVVAILLADGRLPPEALLGIGTYATVVRDPATSQ